MELNHYGDIVMPVITQEDIVEGRFVLLSGYGTDYDYGSRTDLPGVRLPDTEDEAALARYMLKFAQDNRGLPIYDPNPSFSWALRYGWDQDENAPFEADVYITHPGVQEGRTIPSGSGAVAYGESTIATLESGAFVYDASLAPGVILEIANTADDGAADAGKPMVGTTHPIAQVIRYDSTNNKLTFRVIV